MTPAQARRFYNRLHADEPRHGDMAAFCIFVAVVAAIPLALIFAIRALWALFFGG